MSTPTNVIVILTDDQGAWAMGCAGNDEVRTPNLDKLAAGGTRFENCFCVSPVCSPARASILTGRIPSAHGVHDWLRAGTSTCEPEGRGLVEYLAGIEGYSDHLARSGYTCGMSGKWHLGDAHHAQKGYSFWRAHARAGGDYMKAPMVLDETDVYFEDRYITDVFTENAISFLEEANRTGKPFCLSLNYTAPHSPWERANHPAELFDAFYNDCAFASVPNERPHPYAVHTDFFDSPERRRTKLAGYFAALEGMDRGVGAIIDWLEGAGRDRDTLVLFTSDNGMNMGHHGICGKGNGTWPVNMYDTSVKVPLIAYQPGTVHDGRVDETLCSHYDLLPTILDAAGLPVPDDPLLPGRSLWPRLTGVATADDSRGRQEGDPARAIVVSAQSEYGPTRMIRTRTEKYVHRYPAGPHEYYDLERDPGERENRIDDPDAYDAVLGLQRRLETWFSHYTTPERDGALLPVTGRGQLGPCTDAPEPEYPFAQLWMKSWW